MSGALRVPGVPGLLDVIKGHGTENDFVVVPDFDGELDLTPHLVRALCDRRAGIGADGVLRVVRSAHVAEDSDAEWFMDYRNADGSIAETCGNGVRVFARYLASLQLIGPDETIGTRGGDVRVQMGDDATVAVHLGRPRLLSERPLVSAVGGADNEPGTCVEMPNPHVVVGVDAAVLDALDLATAPTVSPALPHGQNVEFVAQLDRRHLRMRVHERGVGETRSCGTGICAAVAANGAPDGSRWRVDVPGGTCHVTWQVDGDIVLAGPAVLVAQVALTQQWLSAVGQGEWSATARR